MVGKRSLKFGTPISRPRGISSLPGGPSSHRKRCRHDHQLDPNLAAPPPTWHHLRVHGLVVGKNESTSASQQTRCPRLVVRTFAVRVVRSFALPFLAAGAILSHPCRLAPFPAQRAFPPDVLRQTRHARRQARSCLKTSTA